MSTKPIHLTVATIVEKEGKFLFVEENVGGALVINQPAGHVENGESITAAAIRETFEETGWQVEPTSLISFYRWTNPVHGESYFRASFAANALEHNAEHVLDSGILRTLWLSFDELQSQAERTRSPLVIRCVQDYLNNISFPLDILVDIPTR